jgi:ParB-like chromosome segregation protein Spo0J
MPNSSQSKTWRDVLPIHPAAEMFPLMSESELRELGEDIKANGLLSSIVIHKGKLLDGRNRLDAMELVGIKFGFMGDSRAVNNKERLATKNKEKFFFKEKFFCLHACDGPDIFKSAAGLIDHFDGDLYAFVLSANIHWRHLTAEQKRDLIAKLLKAKPEQSDRQIAKQTKTSPTTVGKIRKEAEATGDVSKVDTRTDTKGRKQPSAKSPKSAKPAPAPAASESRLRSVSAEDITLENFTSVAMKLIKLIMNNGSVRFANAALPDDDIRYLWKFFADLSKIRQDSGSTRQSAEVSEQRKAEHAALDEAGAT